MRNYVGPIARIQAAVARRYQIKYTDMFSPARDAFYSHPRQIAMYLARELTDSSITVIGQRFRRDHSTVCHAIKAVEQRFVDDSALRKDVARLRARIEAEWAKIEESQ